MPENCPQIAALLALIVAAGLVMWSGGGDVSVR
jgi:hypothetical protein